MNSLRILPTWTPENDDNSRNNYSFSKNNNNNSKLLKNAGGGSYKNGSLTGFSSPNIVREQRSVSVKELPRTAGRFPSASSIVEYSSSSAAMINSSSDSSCWSQSVIDIGGCGGDFTSASVCNLDFSSTESVNRWFSQMLAELNSIPNVSLTDGGDNDGGDNDGKLERHLIGGIGPIVDRKLQEACSGLRDVGRLDSATAGCSSSSSVEEIFPEECSVSDKKIKNRLINETSGGYDIIYDDNSLFVTHSDDKPPTRSSYTWPLEQTKSCATNRNDDDDKENESNAETTLSLLASTGSSCEIYRNNADSFSFIESSPETRRATVIIRSSKDLTPTPSLDDVYSSVTPLASPDVERKSSSETKSNYCLSKNINDKLFLPNRVSSSHDSPTTTTKVCGVGVQKTDVATEISNSLKMYHHQSSPTKVNSRSTDVGHPWGQQQNESTTKPKKVAQVGKGFFC